MVKPRLRQDLIPTPPPLPGGRRGLGRDPPSGHQNLKNLGGVHFGHPQVDANCRQAQQRWELCPPNTLRSGLTPSMQGKQHRPRRSPPPDGCLLTGGFFSGLGGGGDQPTHHPLGGLRGIHFWRSILGSNLGVFVPLHAENTCKKPRLWQGASPGLQNVLCLEINPVNSSPGGPPK